MSNIALNYISDIGKVKKDFLLEDFLDNLVGLRLRASSLPEDEMEERLRAFYAVEYMYSNCVLNSLGRVFGIITKDKTFMNLEREAFPFADALLKKLPRSWSGLKRVIQCLDGLDRQLVLESTEAKFSLTGRISIEVITESRVEPASRIIGYTKEAATLLCSQLKEDASQLPRIGTLLALAVLENHRSTSEQLNLATSLISISKTTPLNPWNTTEESQV